MTIVLSPLLSPLLSCHCSPQKAVKMWNSRPELLWAGPGSNIHLWIGNGYFPVFNLCLETKEGEEISEGRAETVKNSNPPLTAGAH